MRNKEIIFYWLGFACVKRIVKALAAFDWPIIFENIIATFDILQFSVKIDYRCVSLLHWDVWIAFLPTFADHNSPLSREILFPAYSLLKTERFLTCTFSRCGVVVSEPSCCSGSCTGCSPTSVHTTEPNPRPKTGYSGPWVLPTPPFRCIPPLSSKVLDHAWSLHLN